MQQDSENVSSKTIDALECLRAILRKKYSERGEFPDSAEDVYL